MRLAMVFTFILLSLSAAPLHRARAENIVISLRNHQFEPPSQGTRAYVDTTIVINNLDVTAAEIGSAALKIAPVLVEPNSQVEFALGRLNPGTYDFFDAFHNDTEYFLVVQ
ncbi:MAG: cupredoxin domain-containing protein [Alphaproteobacteria bacterium]|nr:MAG: cupredoxin domain-containing protein [Alphaproteobacteria bacterium]